MTSVLNRLQLLSGNNFFSALILAAAFTVASCSTKTIQPQMPTGPSAEKTVKDDDKRAKEPAVFSRNANKEPVISLVLPFNVDKIDLSTASTKKDLEPSAVALDFYQGFRLGLDSATQNGKKIKLMVFDSKDDTVEVRNLARKQAIINSNLVIGPLYPSEIRSFNPIAVQNQQYFVSPLSPRVVVKGNPYFIVPVCPMEIHARKAAEFIIKKFETNRLMILKGPDSDEENFVKPFKAAFEEQSIGTAISEYRTTSNTFDPMVSKLVKGQNNILLVSSANKAFWQALLKFLDKNSKEYSFTVFAYPGSERLATSLGLKNLEKYNLYFTSSYHIDRNEPGTAAFFTRYKQAYAVEPSEYAIKGFDIGFFFAKLLSSHITDYDKYINKFYNGIHNNFQFVKTENGFLNESLKVLKVENSKFVEQK
ncbi:ABC transporter substrate-binding protein [Solitalea lacus]|uniref:ABC transporter substrate-binding protein n=1 Tax=Solitalea lacus TaxID=2911172 RepID=UPI001EDB346F|nr:ABC transporter substrate-binding protein [Solitalea lacus]UKJ08913.1 ABC transporter substrate-binding protein [Solitalea lacus]